MDISLFLAQVFGLYFVIVGVLILIRPTATRQLLKSLSSRNATYCIGFITLLAGVPLVLLHNVWDGSWRVIITLLVWITLFKGIARIYVPELIERFSEILISRPVMFRHMLWLVVLAGMYLMYLGFEWSV
jgi:hypothetical protein